MNKQKLQLIFSAVCLALSILMLAGTTFAYFTVTKQVTHTMTAGNITIELTEAAIKEEGGHLVQDTAADRIVGGGEVTVRDYGKLYPSMTVYKDPTIENTGSIGAWIAAKVTFTDGEGELHKVIGYDGFPGIDIRMILSGGILDEGTRFGRWNGIDNVRYNDIFAMVQKADVGMGEYSFYFFFLQPFEQGEKVVLFDTLGIPPQWNNAQMQELAQLKINVQAYGVQMLDLDSCFEAMTLAFAEEFPF